jgi:molybdopterin-binding protein
MQISARNQLSGTVAEIVHGAVTTTVKIRLGGGDTITASITREAAKELALAEGSSVTAVIKASDVLVATDS